MIQMTVSKRKYKERNLRKTFEKVLEIDPVGPISKLLCDRLHLRPQDLCPETIAIAMRKAASLGDGRFYHKSSAWWAPKKRRVSWTDNIFYVTKEEDLLLGWHRYRPCDPYRLIFFLNEESLEVFFAKLYGWQYVPTRMKWNDLESKDVIEHLEW